jgi:hypothetical protein
MAKASPGIERTRHDLEDREPDVVTTKFFDADGNEITVDPSNPLPVESLPTAITEDISSGLVSLICELQKTNKYLSILTGVEL